MWSDSAEFRNCTIFVGGEEVKSISGWSLSFDYKKENAKELTIEELLDIIDEKLDDR